MISDPKKITSAQFEPITPEKKHKAEYRQDESAADSSVDDVPTNKEKENATDGVKRSQPSESMSTPGQANHKPDREGMEEADLSKTPQQKPRRKKHRPKVIIEGQKKTTPKARAEKTGVPRESTTEKRKYARKNKVNSPAEGETSESYLDRSPNTETPVAKRRYARRKTNDPEVNMDRGTTETKEAKVTRSTRSSCKRSLNFNSDGSQAEKSKVEEVEVMATSHEVAHKVVNQVNERCLSSLEEHPRRPSTAADQAMCTRGKCQIVFSDVTHDKEANAVQMPKSQSDSIGNSACLNSEQERSLKRKSINTTVEAVCNRNETGILYNSVQACAPYFPTYPQSAYVIGSTPGLHFPTIYKKKRTEKGSMPTSSAQVTASAMASHARLQRNAVGYSCTKMFMSPTNQGYVGALNEAYNPLFHHANDGTRTGRQVFADLLALGATQSFRRRRSRGPTRRRNVASLLEELPASSRMRHEPHTCMEALVADTRSTMTTKKRSKRSTFVSATVQNPFHHQNFASTSSGPPLALTWKSMSPIDSIVEQLNQLHLSAESSRPLQRRYNVLAAFSGYQEQHALVPYQSSAAVVPFDNSFDEVRRRRPRPKVELDDETTRVWKLLLENINSEGVDGTDEDKAKWWEEERRVFKGRADSFIARMHLVQGDRRFSPWKGSVVDSVVGVFLTQNVSDHLSSSAFMSMAARYPVKSEIHPAEAREENLGCKINEPEICELDSDRKFVLNKEILNQSVCCENTKNSEIATNKSISLGENGRDAEDALSSQTPEISSQNSADSPVAQTTERSEFYLPVTSEGGATVGVVPNRANNSTPFVKLLQMAETVLQGGGSDSLASNVQTEGHFGNPMLPAKTRASCSQSTLSNVPNSGTQATALELTQRNRNCGSTCSSKEFCAAEISEFSSESACGTTIQKTAAVSFDESQRISSPNAHSCNNEQIEVDKKKVGNHIAEGTAQNKLHGISGAPNPQNLMDATGSTSNIDNSKGWDHREVNSNKNGLHDHPGNMFNGAKAKGGRPKKEKENQVDWDHLRKQTDPARRERARTANTMDSVDWEAVRCADVSDIAQTIKERGMNNMLAERIKDFLNRIVRDHGSIDLEWLRDVPPDKAKEYLLSVRGLGLKSVECVRLLTLHHLAFPVDTNVGRIAVRLGWVPLQPLPESLQLHLLELYPILESIQKFLWPRLCKLDQKTLYELHYQMITFGKVFCTKSKPNCNACPMRGECRHFASAFASARLALPAPQDQSIVSASENIKAAQNPINSMNTLQLPPIRGNAIDSNFGVSNSQPIIEEPASPEPIIEVPATPEPDQAPILECDIEDISNEDPDEIPTIQLNMDQFTQNLQSFMQQNTELQEGDMSKALVALTSAAASIPVPKLKNVSRLRTEHQVYELPDSHPLLEGMDKREPDDPSPYLLAIWTPGETMDSIEPPEKRCSSQGLETLCSDETCLSCNSIREANSQTVRGTLLIPCRTAMRGSFPLNGTYFQVNEVFSDHETSLSPIDVPRAWLWNLSRRTVYFGTSIPTIFKGLSTEGIQYCFWRGFVCVRGFDRRTRAPRPLIARLHFPASKLNKGKGKMDDNHA